jgi:hypothetical protein
MPAADGSEPVPMRRPAPNPPTLPTRGDITDRLATGAFTCSSYSPFIMGVSLPDDVLLYIAQYLEIDHLRGLLAVSRTFCHLAMRARYGAVVIEQLPSTYDDVYDNRMVRTARLRYCRTRIIGVIRFFRHFTCSLICALRDPFVARYVRSLTIKLCWSETPWENDRSIIIHRPTLVERHALAATVTALPAVDELVLDWMTMGNSQQPLDFFSAAWKHLAPRLRKLTLRATIFDLDCFTTAVELEPATSLEEIHIEMRASNTWNNPSHDLQFTREAATRRGLSALVPVIARSSSTLREFTAVISWQTLRDFSAALSELSAVDLPRLVRLTARGFNPDRRSTSLPCIAQPLCSMIERHASTLEELTLNWLSDANQIEVWLQSGRLPRLRKLVLYNEDPAVLVLHNEDPTVLEYDGIETPNAPTTLGRWFSCAPALQELSIRGRALGEEQLLSLVPSLAKCPSLRTIELRCHQLTAKVFHELLRACPSLVTLKCTASRWILQVPPSRITIDTWSN